MKLDSISAGMLVLAEKYVPATHLRTMLLLRDSKEGLSAQELAASLELTKGGIKKIVRILAEHRIIYVKGWRRNKVGPMVALYGLGKQPNAERPPKYAQGEKNKRWREKNNYAMIRSDRPQANRLSLAGQVKSLKGRK